MEDEGALKGQIEHYQKRIFALVFCLIGRDRDKAYDIAVDSFVEAIRLTSDFEKEEGFLKNDCEGRIT